MTHVFGGPWVFWVLAHAFRGPKVLDPGSCLQRPRIFGSWLMFSEDQGFFGLWLMFSKDQRFRILAHVFRGLGFWGLAHVFRGPRVFWALAHAFRGPKVPNPDSCFQRPRIFGSWLMFSVDQGFLGFGSCFQRTKGSRSWLMFIEDQGCFGLLAHVFRGLKVLDPS